jgi:hypothetical protein
MDIRKLSASNFSVGQEVVVGHLNTDGSFNPCRCNGVANPEHPCRTTVTKVGRTKLTVVMTGYKEPKVSAPATGDHFVAMPLEHALPRYERALRRHGNKPEADVQRCLRSL